MTKLILKNTIPFENGIQIHKLIEFYLFQKHFANTFNTDSNSLWQYTFNTHITDSNSLWQYLYPILLRVVDENPHPKETHEGKMNERVHLCKVQLESSPE